jgi:hypothetical protein
MCFEKKCFKNFSSYCFIEDYVLELCISTITITLLYFLNNCYINVMFHLKAQITNRIKQPINRSKIFSKYRDGILKKVIQQKLYQLTKCGPSLNEYNTNKYRINTSQMKQLQDKPEKPDDEECCGSGCKNCVFVVYESKLEEYSFFVITLSEYILQQIKSNY